MNLWKKIPLAKVALGFLLGLFLSIELTINLGNNTMLVALGLFALILVYRFLSKNPFSLRIQGALWLVLFLVLGIWRGELHRKTIYENWINQKSIESADGFIVQLSGDLSEKKNSYKSEATIIGISRNDSLINHHEKTICYFSKTLDVAQLLRTDAFFTTRKPSIIQEPKNPGEFNYKKYLSGLGVQTQFYLDSSSLSISTVKTEQSFMGFFRSLKTSSLETLKKIGIRDEAFGVIAALVFGEKDFLDSETYRSYGAAGATHVLAVSGLHVGLIYLILLKICSPFRKRKFGKILTLFVGLTGLWFYAAITGFSPSVLRASTMFSAILIGQQINKNSSIYNTLSASAILLLFISPNLLMEVGFQLSYSAVLGILLIQPWLYRLWTPNLWLVDKAWQLSTVSIAAQLGTFPLGMLYFHQFPNYFLLSNLIVIPAATFILYLTLIALCFSFSEVISKFLGYVLQCSVEFLNAFIAKIQSLPHAIAAGIDISILECFMLYAVLIFTFRTLIEQKFGTVKYALVLMVGFLALQCQEKLTQSNQSFIMVHSLRNSRAISIVEGKKATLLASEKFLENEEKIKFHISHFWNKVGADQTDLVNIDHDFLESNFFKIYDNRIFFRDYQISLKNDQNNSQSATHVFMNWDMPELPENSALIKDGKTRVSDELETENTVFNAREKALRLY